MRPTQQTNQNPARWWRSQTREIACKSVTDGFRFNCYWFEKWREISQPVTNDAKALIKKYQFIKQSVCMKFKVQSVPQVLLERKNTCLYLYHCRFSAPLSQLSCLWLFPLSLPDISAEYGSPHQRSKKNQKIKVLTAVQGLPTGQT